MQLELQLECELPRELSVGAGTALFLCGWCFCAQQRLRSLRFLVGGEPQPVMAFGMPRLDPFQAFEHPNSYSSGFWGMVRIGPEHTGSELVLGLRAELESGGEVEAELGRVPLAREPEASPNGAPGPQVAICMATYNPPLDLFGPQIESIRAQAHSDWVCMISDDCSTPARYEAMLAMIGDDPRFVVSRAPGRLGFYRNFERALELAPRGCEVIAMADQDDAWHADKLTSLIAALGDAQLVYSDARVVARDGRVLSDTWWSTRRNNHQDLLSLLVANAVTGAASLFRRELLDYALPFPPAQFAHFHDHWIGLTALALGEIAFVERPLYDYVQHDQASLGHAGANRMTSLADRLRHQRSGRERVRMWRLHYFVDACRLLQFATILELRCWPRMEPAKRRTLARFLSADRSLLALAELGFRGARELLGGTPETLGAEWMLFLALGWRRLLALSARERPQRRLRLDALPPPSLVLQPGRVGLPAAVSRIADKIAPLQLAPSDDAPTRVNILIPTIDLAHFFGGYIAKFNLAGRLLERGKRVRIVTVDPVGPLPGDWRRTLEAYSGLERLFDSVEVVFGRESAGIECNRGDQFIASTWWTAHIAHSAVQTLGGERFGYLIQEYEPFTFPMGTYAALARESYGFPHYAVFSSELLRDYFRRNGIGVYAVGTAGGDRDSIAFENALTHVPPPAVETLDRRTRRLLFYARPEPHASRNMFELGVLALSRACADGAFEGDWALHGIGGVGGGRRVPLGGSFGLELLPRADQDGYARMLSDHDLGLALMYTPHPSLVPLEMASAGMLTVTNSCENKTPEALAEISSNLICAEPSIEALTAALHEAVAGISHLKRRVAGAEVRWSRDWRSSFDEQLLDRLIAALDPAGAAAR
jgi:glycosyltransferase involved in cell wall biosynthesis